MTDAGTIIVSSRWGMPLEQYIPVYGIKQYRPDSVENIRYERARVLDDIKQVSAFSQGGLHDCDHISISTLHSILHYSYSPLSYLDLGSPALITGCIKVMSEIRLMGKVSPLSYELGYACFRVIAIGLSICLLRSGAELGLDPGKTVMEVELLHLTEHVVTHNITRQLQDLAMHLGGHSNDQNHCIIGWSACPEHPRCSAIVSPGDVHILLNMLYDDRSLLLKAFESACPTGISAVVFLLWRYVNYQRYLTGHQTSKEYDLFQTVFWRCFVIATNPEQELFTAIWGQEHGLWPSRKASPMLGVELEDSKTLIVAFINRLGRAKNDLYQTLILTDLLQSLAFIKEHLLPGCQDLIAPCLGAVIEHVWGIFVRQETSDLWSYPNADVPGTLGKIFEEFDIIIQVMLRWREILPETVEQIVKEIIRTELLDLVGRTFLSLSPALDRSQESHTYYVNALVLQCSRALFQNLSKLVSPSILEARFRHYGQDWWKINHQILFLSQGIPPRELSLVGRGFLDTRADVWGSIGKIIQQPIAETSPKLFCGYMRCPDPVIMMGSIYKCAGCRQAAYCSPRCQAMDWWKNNLAVSHCVLCNFRIDRGLDGKTV